MISGPNGMPSIDVNIHVCIWFIDLTGRMCVPVIKSCEFRNGCYRAPFKEQHLEIYDENGQTKQRWKVGSQPIIFFVNTLTIIYLHRLLMLVSVRDIVSLLSFLSKNAYLYQFCRKYHY